MIEFVCAPSPIHCMPIRRLLASIGFRPQNNRQMAALSFLYPFNTSYRGSLQSLGHLECVPDVQFLGFATQWRTRRRFTALALAIAPLIEREKVTIYCAEHMGEISRIFFATLSHYVSPDSVRLVYGAPQRCSAIGMAATTIQPEESELIELLEKDVLSVDEQDSLTRYGTACALVANYSQGEAIYAKLAQSCDSSFGFHCLGMTGQGVRSGVMSVLLCTHQIRLNVRVRTML